jgi:anion-transporting  ArsA/GET3 family ATPase
MARVTNTAATAFSWTVRRLAGPQIVEDTIEFFRLLSGLEDGLRARAKAVSAMLREPTTAFVLVSSPRAEAIDEAVHLRDALRAERYPLGATIANMVHPMPPDCDLDDATVPSDSALADQLDYHRELTALATAERVELGALWPTTTSPEGDGPIRIEIPLLDRDVHGLDTLTELADLLVG